MSPLHQIRTHFSAALSSFAPNPWKISTLVLTVALLLVIGREIPAAEAAGPARLGKALSALKASKKFLDDAKDPPVPFHQQSLATVNQAISAVEKEIKAYEAAKDKEKAKEHKADGASKSDAKGDAKKKAKDAPSKKSDSTDEG
jgi:hypothetical protein